jgi:hypothetical protein
MTDSFTDGLKTKYKTNSLNKFEERVKEWEEIDKGNVHAVDAWVSNLLSEWYKTDQQRIEHKVDGSTAEHKAKALEDHLAIAEAGAVHEPDKVSLGRKVLNFFTNRSK